MDSNPVFMGWKKHKIKQRSPVVYRGSHLIGPPTEVPFYVTPSLEYAQAYGYNVSSYEFNPVTPLDLRGYSNKQVSYRKLKEVLVSAGIEVPDIDTEYRSGISDTFWFWLRRFPQIVEAIKLAGYDSILMIETNPDIRGKYESAIVLDSNIARDSPHYHG